MHKYLLLFCLNLAVSLSLSAKDKGPIINCNITGCSETLSLFKFNGLGFDKVLEGNKLSDSVFVFKIKEEKPAFYHLASDPREGFVTLVLEGGEKISIAGKCNDLKNVTIEGANLNTEYVTLKTKIDGLANETSTHIYRLRTERDSTAVASVVKKLNALDQEKINLLYEYKEKSPFLAKILAVNTYLSYLNNKGQYTNEIEYFANEYFKFADLSHADYNSNPWTYEAFKAYTNTLNSSGIPTELHGKYLDKSLAKLPEGTSAHKMAMLAVIRTLHQKNHSNYIPFIDKFVAIYNDKDPQAAAALKSDADKIRNFMIGGTPPDFTLKTPEGKELSLANLKGKVVLVDFWASWCGPCRKENPHIVKIYEKYKSKGFDILGVSLDRSKDRWVSAIKQDGLVWSHVSDLKGWKNEVAQMYGVRSIPHTFLLDAEGRIIARNLRAHQLEAKLAELLD